MATQIETLTAISEAMKVEPYYLFMTVAAAKTIVKKGFAEQRLDITNEDSQFATRLTASGLAEVNSTQAVAPIVKVPTMTQFVIGSAPVPTSPKRAGGAGRHSKYPFDSLEVGQYFFVPDTAKQPEPAKSLGSVVTSANRKYAVETAATRVNRKGVTVPVLEYNRKFIVRPFSITDAAGELIHGAGVWREK